ncbi:dna mismatch repair protein msh6 [Nicotiana attenuata]|uniref:Dna mismatch repair protein msh6 n=1 Tax=Nicotiana attenuata TaxID=49451 RepID=A0A1J6IIZ9_NICAT|nr:dna mismatch repair protein msh6 [Nicotiana attenuata]
MAASASSTLDSSQKEIEDELKDCGIRLIIPPPSTEELLNLLDKVESLLIKVGQAPSDSMKDALRPVMRAMVGSELVKNADVDVKFSVVSCLCELSRITAPQQPYDDGLMKEIFQLIVRAFEELSHSARHYYKAVHILETVADVKACVMLLDLECDALVIEIFQLFLTIIRPDHPNVVFKSMEEIMTLLIEESDEISMELLQPLLDSVRKENQICSPISSKLGEKVLKECASTVRPYLVEALKSRSMNLDDYAEIVASICNEMPEGEQMLYSQTEQLKNIGISNGSHGCRVRAKKKQRMPNKEAHLGVLVPEGDVLQSQDKRNGSLHSVLNFGGEHKGTACSKRKPRQSSKKSESVPKGDADTTSGLNIVRGGDLTDAKEPSVQQVDEKKQKNDKATIETHDVEETGDEAIKLSFGDENLSSKLGKTKRQKKLAMGKDENSKRRHITKNYGEEMVGTRIRVWWPLDKVFYEGAVTEFDPVKKRHKILYYDEQVETLNLTKERWEMVGDNPSDKYLQKHETDLQCNAVSSVPSMKKKAKRTSSTKREPGVSSSKRSKRNAQKGETESMDIPVPDEMNDATDVGCATSSRKKDPVDKEDNMINENQISKNSKVDLESSLMLEDHPSDKKHETDLQSSDVSSIPSKKAKRTSSKKREPGISSSKRSKRKAQKSDIESPVIPIPDKMNDATDVGCETSTGQKDLVDKEDNTIAQKQRSETFILSLDSSLTLEDRPSDKKHETDPQSNDVSSVLLMNKKAKRTSSTKREPRVSSSKRSGKNAQKSDIESLDIPYPDKMNDATDVICETSSGQKDLVHKEDNIITEAEIQDFQSGNLELIKGSALTASSKLSNGALESSLTKEAN